jgi:hypothetical protein
LSFLTMIHYRKGSSSILNESEESPCDEQGKHRMVIE